MEVTSILSVACTVRWIIYWFGFPHHLSSSEHTPRCLLSHVCWWIEASTWRKLRRRSWPKVNLWVDSVESFVARFLRWCVDAWLGLTLCFEVALPFFIDVCVYADTLTIDVVNKIVSYFRQRASSESRFNKLLMHSVFESRVIQNSGNRLDNQTVLWSLLNSVTAYRPRWVYQWLSNRWIQSTVWSLATI